MSDQPPTTPGWNPPGQTPGQSPPPPWTPPGQPPTQQQPAAPGGPYSPPPPPGSGGPPTGPYAPGGPGPGWVPPGAKRSKTPLIIGAAVVVVLLIAGLVAVFALGGDDEEADPTTTTSTTSSTTTTTTETTTTDSTTTTATDGTVATPDVPDGFQLVEGDGFALAMPETWEEQTVDDSLPGGRFQARDAGVTEGFADNLNVLADESQAGRDVTDGLDTEVQAALENAGFSDVVTNDQLSGFGGTDVLLVTYTGTATGTGNEEPIMGYQIWIGGEAALWTLTITVNEESGTDAPSEIADSFSVS